MLGYPDKGKIVDPANDEVVSYATSWQVAADQSVSELPAANSCEGLDLKVEICQLEAF